MKDYEESELRQVNGAALPWIEFCLKQLFECPKAMTTNSVATGLILEEVVSALVAAERDIHYYKSLAEDEQQI